MCLGPIVEEEGRKEELESGNSISNGRKKLMR